jgi:hypothetical protein
MGNPQNVDLTADVLYPLGFGLIFKAVCAPSSWSAEKVAEVATRMDPPGTSLNQWVVSDPDPEREEPFKGVNNTPCPDECNRTHWLLNC